MISFQRVASRSGLQSLAALLFICANSSANAQTYNVPQFGIDTATTPHTLALRFNVGGATSPWYPWGYMTSAGVLPLTKLSRFLRAVSVTLGRRHF